MHPVGCSAAMTTTAGKWFMTITQITTPRVSLDLGRVVRTENSGPKMGRAKLCGPGR